MKKNNEKMYKNKKIKENILSLDSSNKSCSVALYTKKKIDYIFDKCKNNYEEKIFPMIKKIIKRNRIKINDIKTISYSNGPGSFSGIRISSIIAKSFFINKKIKLLSISSLKIIAENCWKISKKKKIIVLLQNKNNNFFYGKYYRNKYGIWIGKKSEKFIKFHKIIKKIVKKKNIVISGKFKKQKIQKELYKQKYKHKIYFFKINFPNAKYMINITKKMLKKYYFRNDIKSQPKYLIKIF
ncbi:tRNA (adenosine(37)-N6)-threonylcarbamoyltransferase complex dimerization subunit type 1 TsaB [Buchnera aphidicola (Astegopteryx bambusae)]|uniref:tRNA (adenosine(37)-N6)-threonylcarbamoyltransferase complex dimerization subunit type 1 TsaB n=1 Tax=Buchnera aphidicola TaxID=9 RepID=UPI0031B855F2